MKEATKVQPFTEEAAVLLIGIDVSMNSNLSSHLHVFGIHRRCRNESFSSWYPELLHHKKGVATLFKDNKSFRCFSALSKQNIPVLLPSHLIRRQSLSQHLSCASIKIKVQFKPTARTQNHFLSMQTAYDPPCFLFNNII